MKHSALLCLILLVSSVGCSATWKNYLRDYNVSGRRYRPSSVEAALADLRENALRGGKLRAVGSGHSSADVAEPVDHEAWMEVSELDEIEGWSLYREQPATRYVRIGAGATIRALNSRLAERGRALYNMGNYDGQTIAGAISTGTHGSGLRHGPLADRVVALELITDELAPESGQRVQRLVRLEPSLGVTDAPAFERAKSLPENQGTPLASMVLEQDDATFDAALISFGTFGVIVSVTLETRELFWLREREELLVWNPAAPPDISSWAHEAPEFLMLQLLPNPMLAGQYYNQVVFMKTVRTEVPPCPVATKRPPNRESLGRVLADIFGTGLLEDKSLSNPNYFQRNVLKTFQQRAQHHFASRSDKVSINSLGPDVTATSSDLWVPLDKGALAINRIVALARELGTPGGPVRDKWWHTSPIGVRVVAKSRALLAPSYDGPRISIEIPLLVDTWLTPEERESNNNQDHIAYRERMLQTLSEELMKPEYGARPHWGQVNWMTAQLASRLYGKNWDCWLEKYRRFNHFDTFSNAFTDRMCLSHTQGRRECLDAPVNPPPHSCDSLALENAQP